MRVTSWIKIYIKIDWEIAFTVLKHKYGNIEVNNVRKF